MLLRTCRRHRTGILTLSSMFDEDEQLAKQLDEYETLMDVGKKRLEAETAQLEKRAQVFAAATTPVPHSCPCGVGRP